MKKYRFYLDIGYVGANHQAEIEVEDDCTEEELEDMFQGWMYNYLDAGYEEIE